MNVLDAVHDADRWQAAWRACGGEPFANPGYCRLMAGDDGRAVALTFRRGDAVVLVPLVIRPIRNADGLCDAVSPYGYGGPFSSGPVDGGEILDRVEEWARETGLCSVFLRLSLWPDVPAEPRSAYTDVVQLADNVVIDLRRTPEALWSNYQHKVRKNVKKALRAGCTVRRDPHLSDVGGFLDIYTATMQRRSATTWYHFSGEFLTELADALAGRHSVFWVLDGAGRPVSVELVLESDRHLYSFLGGTLAEAFTMAPNDLLKHEVSRYGQETGRDGFVLGGGFTPGDGIYAYKRSFDPGGVRAFRAARMTGDKGQYDALVAQLGAGDHGSFFPAYRAPLRVAVPA